MLIRWLLRRIRRTCMCCNSIGRKRRYWKLFVICGVLSLAVLMMYGAAILKYPGFLFLHDDFSLQSAIVSKTLGSIPPLTDSNSTTLRPKPTEVQLNNNLIVALPKEIRNGTPYPYNPPPLGTGVVLIGGTPRSKQGLLTIGLCTVPRKHVTYLFNTIRSLLAKMAQDDSSNVCIVVFLGSLDQTWISNISSQIDHSFHNELVEGLILVIAPTPEIYPDFTRITKRNFNDTLDRVHWRTKQNIDFAFLFGYCSNISTYYIHLEDDVIAASNYVQHINSFIQKHSGKKWISLEFSQLGFIGKLFHSSDLMSIGSFLMMFMDDAPGDILFAHLKRMKGQGKDIVCPYSLFQHVGKVSSLANKTQNLTDKKFKDKLTAKNAVFIHNIRVGKKAVPNPKASVHTDLTPYGRVNPADIYEGRFIFWAAEPKKGQKFIMQLDQPEHLTRILIETGHIRAPKDILKQGVLKIGVSDAGSKCQDVREIAKFKHGVVDVHLKPSDFPKGISCVIVELTADQDLWLIISNIVLTKEMKYVI